MTWRLSGRSNLFSLDWSHRLHIVLALKLWIIWTFRCLFYFDIYSYCSRKKKTRKWLQTAAREEVWLLRNSNFFFCLFFTFCQSRTVVHQQRDWCDAASLQRWIDVPESLNDTAASNYLPARRHTLWYWFNICLVGTCLLVSLLILHPSLSLVCFLGDVFAA